MATNFIPRIDYEELTLTGTTAVSSDTITAIADTSLIVVGMYIEGTGIPAETTVLSKTASTVVMSNQATAAGTVSINYFKRIVFDYPPKADPFGERLSQKAKVSTSKSGQIQTTVDFRERLNKVTFSFLSQTLKDDLETFLLDWGLEGNEFSYYLDKDDVATKSTRTLEARSRSRANFKVVTRKGAGLNFLWEISLTFRELL